VARGDKVSATALSTDAIARVVKNDSHRAVARRSAAGPPICTLSIRMMHAEDYRAAYMQEIDSHIA
jgi:hypothetical protein